MFLQFLTEITTSGAVASATDLISGFKGILVASGVSIAAITPIVAGIVKGFKTKMAKRATASEAKVEIQTQLSVQREATQASFNLNARKRELAVLKLSAKGNYVGVEKQTLLDNQIAEIEAEIAVLEVQAQANPGVSFSQVKDKFSQAKDLANEATDTVRPFIS